MESAKSNVMSRIVYLDSLRGFAILLVIIGHLIQFNYKSGIENHIFNLIYSFHMPLFFFISGLCTNFVKETSTLRELFNYGYKKFYQLIIPSIVWTIVVPLFFSCKYTVSNISINTISGYWFLNTLFVVCMLWSVYVAEYYRINPVFMFVCNGCETDFFNVFCNVCFWLLFL